jgi:hypothetical protein
MNFIFSWCTFKKNSQFLEKKKCQISINLKLLIKKTPAANQYFWWPAIKVGCDFVVLLSES